MQQSITELLPQAILETRGQISQTKFGQLVGVSPSTVHSWEKGKTLPDYEKLILIADLRGVKIEEFIALTYGRKLPDGIEEMNLDELSRLLWGIARQMRVLRESSLSPNDR